jgi:hypothetical protein
MKAQEIVRRAVDAAEAGGIEEVRAIAKSGPSEMAFSDVDMATLVEAYGAPADALYAIQLEAQSRLIDDAAPSYRIEQETSAGRSAEGIGDSRGYARVEDAEIALVGLAAIGPEWRGTYRIVNEHTNDVVSTHDFVTEAGAP